MFQLFIFTSVWRTARCQESSKPPKFFLPEPFCVNQVNPSNFDRIAFAQFLDVIIVQHIRITSRLPHQLLPVNYNAPFQTAFFVDIVNLIINICNIVT